MALFLSNVLIRDSDALSRLGLCLRLDLEVDLTVELDTLGVWLAVNGGATSSSEATSGIVAVGVGAIRGF